MAISFICGYMAGNGLRIWFVLPYQLTSSSVEALEITKNSEIYHYLKQNKLYALLVAVIWDCYIPNSVDSHLGGIQSGLWPAFVFWFYAF